MANIECELGGHFAESTSATPKWFSDSIILTNHSQNLIWHYDVDVHLSN
jgi:hypothetical protein